MVEAIRAPTLLGTVKLIALDSIVALSSYPDTPVTKDTKKYIHCLYIFGSWVIRVKSAAPAMEQSMIGRVRAGYPVDIAATPPPTTAGKVTEAMGDNPQLLTNGRIS